MRERSWIAYSGFAFVAAWIIGLIVAPSSPALTASAAEVSDYFINNRNAAMLQTYLIDGIAGISILVFSAGVRNVFRKSERGSTILYDVVLGAGVASASVSLVQAALGETLASSAAEQNPEAILMLFNIFNTSDTFKMLALALLSGITAILIFYTNALPKWIGWMGAVLSLALIIGGLSFVLESVVFYNVLYIALPLLLIWVAAISIVVFRRAEPAEIYTAAKQ